MTAPHADQLIEGYLARLRAAAADLPTTDRDELLADVQAHIAEARGRQAEETDASILNILDRLGEPSVVVSETRERLGLRSQPIRRSGLVEIAAIVLLPTIWIFGVILLWWSTAWRTRDKVIGTVCSLGGYPVVLIVGGMVGAAVGVPGFTCGGGVSSDGVVTESCAPPPPAEVIAGILGITVLVAVVLLPVMTSIYLALQLRRRRRSMALAT